MFQAILIIIVFVLLAAGMMSRKLPALIALPLMAVLVSVIAGIPGMEILNGVIGEGSIRLSSAMTAAMFGGVLSQVVNRTGIAKSIIRRAAELAGDKPTVVAVVMALAVAFVFTSIGGLGAFIMVGTIVLPIMISVGIPGLTAGSIMLLAFKVGILFNVYNYAFYSEVLGIEIAQLKTFALVYSAITAIGTLIFILVNVNKEKLSTAWAMPNAELIDEEEEDVPLYALLTPVIPIVLVFIFDMHVIPAILAGVIYGILTTQASDFINVFSTSFIEGIKESAPALGLMIGVGMVLLAVSHELTAEIMEPLITAILPSSKAGFVLFFAILSPLALYRGPLNLWGLGSGIAVLMLGAGTLSPMAITGALLALSAVQDVSDPTNTHNVWLANFIEEDTAMLLRKTFPYVFGIAVASLVYTAIFLW